MYGTIDSFDLCDILCRQAVLNSLVGVAVLLLLWIYLQKVYFELAKREPAPLTVGLQLANLAEGTDSHIDYNGYLYECDYKG